MQTLQTIEIYVEVQASAQYETTNRLLMQMLWLENKKLW